MKKLALKPLKPFNDNIWVNWVICEATLYLCYLCLVYCYCYCLVAILVANYFVTPWTVTCQTPLPTSFPRQEYWSGLPFPSPGDLPNPGIEPCLPHCRQTLYHLSHQGSPPYINTLYILSLLNSRPDTIIGTDNMFLKCINATLTVEHIFSKLNGTIIFLISHEHGVAKTTALFHVFW